MITNYPNDEASASGIITIVAIFLLAGFLLIANGYVVDVILEIANTASFATAPATQMRYDIVQLQVMLFRFLPILVLISLGINRLLAANREFSEVAPLSSLSFGVVEMVFLEIVALVVTVFGGHAIDTVVSTMTSFTMGGSEGLRLMSGVIQYTPNIFAGCMFLISCGIAIQFVLEAVQVADHSDSFTASNY